MKRIIKNDGEYLEVDADVALGKIEEMLNAQILVISKSRIELAGSDKIIFMERLKALLEENHVETEKLSESQKFDFILRKMILSDGRQHSSLIDKQ